MQRECLKLTDDPRRGKNMWALGLLCALYQRDMDIVRNEIKKRFAKKGEAVLARNLDLVEAGYQWGLKSTDLRFEISAGPEREAQAVMNGNQAVGLGIMAAGMELCAMYPITPATSVSHFLAAEFPKVGGFVHQAEDEIAAVGFAIGSFVRGQDGRHDYVRARTCAQNRVSGTGRHRRDPAGRGGRAKRWTLDGTPDENRTGRSAGLAFRFTG